VTPLSKTFYQRLCLLTAAANCLGNAAIVIFWKPIFDLPFLRLPAPRDMHSFVFESALSFTMGVGAYLVFRSPDRNVDLLKVGIVGKGLFAITTYYYFAFGGLHLFYLLFGIWDVLFVVIFFLFLIQLQSPDLGLLLRGDIFAGLPKRATRRALLIGFSLTGNGTKALARVRQGLESGGYSVDERMVAAMEPIFSFPMSFVDFWWIVARAAFRMPAKIAPLDVPPDHEYDLIVVEGCTWLLGISAPIQSLFEHAETRLIFENRDVAALVVCRGAYRRSHAMLVRALQRSGGNVVGARAWTHEGWEPSRLLSLWLYLIYQRAGQPRWLNGLVQKHYGPSEESFNQMERFGADLAGRTRAHFVTSERSVAHE
jgi:hypothetical protein